MTRTLLAAATVAALVSAAAAQTANSSPTSGVGAGSGAESAVRTPPAGGTSVPNPGQPQIGAPTATEQHYEHKAQKDTASVCKGC